MRKSAEIKTNPEVLKELRETSGYSVDEIAKKIKTTIDKINETEKGLALFTLTQIKKLADIYHRPLAAFFTDTLPKMPILADYRINREKRLAPEVYTAQRRAHYLTNKLVELMDKRSQIPNFPETLEPDKLADEFRKYLKPGLLKSIKPEELLAHYKQVLEEKLLISIIELPLKADDVRGFSISSNISCIVLNEGDKPQIKLFSLFHEVYHLIKRTSGICSIEIEQKGAGIEPNCDSFAAEFLVPLDDLKEERKKFLQLDETSISKLSEIYGVSKQVIMLRLLWSKDITKERYNQFKKEGVKEFKEKTFGRRNWNKVFQNRVGNLALGETTNAYRSGKISYSEVFDILNTKTKYIEKFLER
ncbi:ImmA/IrrE family metallo-endopeptidase [candidate division NPL-UPA2 bacterium Unc8]|uniref:ImmA/IrrE family metallo-endopeptidase n=1 Tax=candidate division NPL-UPA2 bacterium Unc8 TaxID=1980939 RepID=A0A399FVS6_UNCN2|nr:MAG: ImmA/IrrE family metallo-endopeptidase [candidate division NPL-UPA2 bacterium Unc8]